MVSRAPVARDHAQPAVAGDPPSASAVVAPTVEAHQRGSGALSQDKVSGEALLSWRRRLLRSAGKPAELDWLLDVAGGLPWGELQSLWLQPQRQVVLQRDRQSLEDI